MKKISWLIILGLVFGLALARAEKPVNSSRAGLAIKGFDPVAYFVASAPVAGLESFEHTWNGATWRFASAENRDKFAAEPGKYAPQFGGYCAWAVSRGYTAGIDPAAWRIVNGKLYLNYNAKVQKQWEEDTTGNIAKAEVKWPEILKK